LPGEERGELFLPSLLANNVPGMAGYMAKIKENIK